MSVCKGDKEGGSREGEGGREQGGKGAHTCSLAQAQMEVLLRECIVEGGEGWC